MIHRLGASGLERIDVSANNAKNCLPVGTVLHLNGYSDPDYVIVKNEGIDEKYGHGARYLTVSLDDGKFSRHDAYALEYLKDKESNRIQMYITDEIKPADEILSLYEKARTLEDLETDQKESADKRRQEMIVKGKEIAANVGVEKAISLVVAEYEKDESDITTDYFSSSVNQLVILALSKHKRDLFSEMRKAADTWEKTEYLGVGKNVYTCRVIIGSDFQSNGACYYKGSRSNWHDELTSGPDGKVFRTRKEAEEWIKTQPKPEDISFSGNIVSFAWGIEEEKIEHREKYSMGGGYYLKDSGRYNTGWKIRKYGKWGEKWSDDVYISLAQICLLK